MTTTTNVSPIVLLQAGTDPSAFMRAAAGVAPDSRCEGCHYARNSPRTDGLCGACDGLECDRRLLAKWLDGPALMVATAMLENGLRRDLTLDEIAGLATAAAA